MNRTDARELLMKLLFQMEAQNDYSASVKDHFFNEYVTDQKQKEYLDKMTFLISEKLNEADQWIASSSENWKIDRLGKVDLAVIRVAILEMFYMDDIPDSVSINEAVEIAKKYGTEGSGKFVNGLLGKVIKMKNANE